jgi:hypothetical protein
MRSHEGSPRNRWALASPAAGLISALMLVLIGFRYKGFPPPSEESRHLSKTFVLRHTFISR